MLKRIDQLNIVLILVAALLALHFPLELFIFSFAILGPLHYLTEINWLNNKNYYFTDNKLWLWIGITSTVLIVVPKILIEYAGFQGDLSSYLISFNSWSNGFIFATLLIAIGYQFIINRMGWLILGVLIISGAILLNSTELYSNMIGLFVPTIIHVYVFTILFMVYGVRRSKSKLGLIAVLLLVIIPAGLALVELSNHDYFFSDYMKSIYVENNFHVTPVIISKTLGLSDGTSFFFYESLELKMMMFLSFIYLYHYLNWFSKTTIIKWYESLNTIKSISILVIWGTLLILFYVDFRLGLLVSLFFNMLHVILEFPLNMLTVKSLFVKS